MVIELVNINFDKVHIYPNIDGTFTYEYTDCEFINANGEVLKGTITFPKVIKKETNLFKADSVSPMSELMNFTIDIFVP